jgi:hypothetical protein
MELASRERVTEHVQVAPNNELLSEMSSQKQIGVPGRSVLSGEDESLFPVYDVIAKGACNLIGDRDISQRVSCLESLDSALPDALTNADESLVEVYVRNPQTPEFTRTHSRLDSKPVK